jgi:putative ABC transport system permease protein
VSGTAELVAGTHKTDPNVRVMAGDENILITSGLEVEDGRSFGPSDIEGARPVAIIGADVAEKLFPSSDPIGKVFRYGGKPYTVIGTLLSKGNSFGLSADNQIFIPITNARANFVGAGRTTAINIKAHRPEVMDQAEGESTALMRKVRKLKPLQEDNFNIMRSDSLAATLISLTSGAKLIGFIIGGITLLGAAIALMNIMLVSVTERTREIGIRKALGASARMIRMQFLTEAILLSQMGGVLGVIFGLLVGNGVALLIGGSFVVPWVWLITGLVLCFGVGVVSGFYPAAQAAKLDPIEALRHE